MLRSFSEFQRDQTPARNMDRPGVKSNSAASQQDGFCRRHARSFNRDDTERLDNFEGLSDLLSSLESFRE